MILFLVMVVSTDGKRENNKISSHPFYVLLLYFLYRLALGQRSGGEEGN